MPKSKKVVNRTSFIDGIITDLIDTSRRPTTQTICRYMQSLNIDSVSSRIGQTFVTAFLARQNAPDGVTDFQFKPEPVIGVLQEIANGLVYRALAIRSAAEQQADFEKLAGGTGQDNYNELLERYGVETISFDNLPNVVADDLETLSQLHAIMRRRCSYIAFEPLFLFSSDQPNPENATGNWIPEYRIESNLDEAMDAVLNRREQAKAREEQSMIEEFANVA